MSRLTDLANAIQAKGIPVVSVGEDRTVQYAPAATPAQRTQGDALAASWDMGARVPRTMLAVRNDLAALTAAQKNAVWADLNSGTPPKWSTDAGPNAAALGAYQLIGSSATLSAADVLEAKLRGVAAYCLDNPLYLVNPTFAGGAGINVPGDQPAP
jgi:hypothetical protein